MVVDAVRRNGSARAAAAGRARVGHEPAAPRPGLARDRWLPGVRSAESVGCEDGPFAPLRLFPPRPEGPLPASAFPAGWAELAPGVRYARTLVNGQVTHALVVEPGTPVTFWAGPPAEGGLGTRTVRQMAQGRVAAVNGSFSTLADAPVSRPVGPTVARGEVRIDSATIKSGWGAVPRSFLARDAEGRFFTGEAAAGEKATALLARLKDQGRQVTDLFGGNGVLLSGGQLADERARSVQGLDGGQASRSANARTVAGVTPDGRLVLLTTEGDAAEGRGVGVHELAQWLLQARDQDPTLKVDEAVILDGGGTAAMVVPGRGVDSRVGLYHRRITTGLVIERAPER
ncbi:MAG: phosphodiester glycosidase family protein [Candidatus Sericytochromatia bacterium]|nr:phosphodiester glycosidase family protein [Candidatus Tanganyikabacteria bacterium]